jgi:hypothetical protein
VSAEPSFIDFVLSEYELGPEERPLLAEIERTLTELDRISASLADSPVVVEGSTGQPRAHPLLAEARAHRDTLAKLVKALGLPSAEDEQPQTPGQRMAREKARHAASVRWRTA